MSRKLAESGMVAILRLPKSDRLMDIVQTLVHAGVTCMELTMTNERALEMLEAVAAAVPADVEIGLGTVTSATEARAAIAAGSRFVVSPTVAPDVTAVALESGIPVYPGAVTPTEIFRAWQAGASAVKLFPAGAFGSAYIGHIRGPLPDIPLIPTGGIGLDDLGAYLRAGCAAVGVGGSLLRDAWDDGSLNELAQRASNYLQRISEIRAQNG